MLERHLMPEVLASLRDTPVTMLIGPRQSGKSTLAEALVDRIDGARYLTLDRGIALGAARDDPAGFISSGGETVIIDEVQRAPELLREIKASVDVDRSPGRFVLTGSADVLTLPGVSETLAGRMEILRLWPLSQGEIEGRRETFLDALLAGDLEGLGERAEPLGKEGLVARAEAGGFPEAIARAGARRARWFDSYLDTVLQREIRDLANIAGLTDLPRLMVLLASRATGLLNYAGISRDLGVPQTTLKRYIALLEATFLLLPVRAWFRNLGKRLVKSPKLILSDAGLLAHLLGSEGAKRFVGPLLENFALMELVKQASVHAARPDLLHHRTAEGVEVDAVIEPRGGPICAVEVKAAATLTPRDSRGLRSLADLLGDDFGAGALLHTGPDAIRLTPKIWALPLAALWAPGRADGPKSADMVRF
jgi:predicted AAA+ superfamily ATPase